MSRNPEYTTYSAGEEREWVREKFPPFVRKAARREARHRCQRCGKKDGSNNCNGLEVHHQLPCWVRDEYYPGISNITLHSKINSLVLCNACHTNHHDNEDKPEQLEFYKRIARVLFFSDGMKD